jgi:hypothetical protein
MLADEITFVEEWECLPFQFSIACNDGRGCSSLERQTVLEKSMGRYHAPHISVYAWRQPFSVPSEGEIVSRPTYKQHPGGLRRHMKTG